MSGKNNQMSVKEMEEKSLKVLHYIENLVDKNEDGTVTSGDVMALLGGTFHLFLKDVREQVSEKRVNEIKAALAKIVMLA